VGEVVPAQRGVGAKTVTDKRRRIVTAGAAYVFESSAAEKRT
jgi:hypothetical protein